MCRTGERCFRTGYCHPAHAARGLATRPPLLCCLGVETLTATAVLDAGEPTKALRLIQDVLSLAAPAGIYRTVLDAGREGGCLLLRSQRTRSEKPTPDNLLALPRSSIGGLASACTRPCSRHQRSRF